MAMTYPIKTSLSELAGTTSLNPVAPASMTTSASISGAYRGIWVRKPLLNTVLATEFRTDAMMFWAKMSVDMPTDKSSGPRVFWIARIGCKGVVVVVSLCDLIKQCFTLNAHHLYPQTSAETE